MKVLLLCVGLAASVAHAQTRKSPTFVPKVGGIVVLYRHQFEADKWAQARETFQSQLWPHIMSDHVDIRDSFILESPEHAEILGITIWRSAADLKRWESLPERNRRQHLLDPFRSRPREEKHFRTLGIGDELKIKANKGSIFVPAPGQIVVVHRHKFKKDKWRDARRIFLRRFETQNHIAHTDVRHSFLIESPERAEIVSITLWHNEKEWSEWKRHEAHERNTKEVLPFKELVSEVSVFRLMDEQIELAAPKPISPR